MHWIYDAEGKNCTYFVAPSTFLSGEGGVSGMIGNLIRFHVLIPLGRLADRAKAKAEEAAKKKAEHLSDIGDDNVEEVTEKESEKLCADWVKKNMDDEYLRNMSSIANTMIYK